MRTDETVKFEEQGKSRNILFLFSFLGLLFPYIDITNEKKFFKCFSCLEGQDRPKGYWVCTAMSAEYVKASEQEALISSISVTESPFV